MDSRFAFRKQFELSDQPTSAPVRVTADARYMLWVNGQFVGRGPARGFPWVQPYDEYDVASFLRPGPNWIAVEVYQFGPGKASGVYVSTRRTGLLMEGEMVGADGKRRSIHTDSSWQALRADWYHSGSSAESVGENGRIRVVTAIHYPPRLRRS